MIAFVFVVLAATPIFALPVKQEQVEAPAQQQSDQNVNSNPAPYYQVYSSALQVPVQADTLITPVSDSVSYYVPAYRSIPQQTYVNQYPYQYSAVYPLVSYIAKASPVEYVQDKYYNFPSVLFYVPQPYYTRIQQQQQQQQVQTVQKTQQQQFQEQNVQKSQQQQYQGQNVQKSQQQQYPAQNLKSQPEPCQVQNVQPVQQEQYQVRNVEKAQELQYQGQNVQQNQYQVQNLEKSQKVQQVQQVEPQQVIETSQQQSVVQVQQQVSEKKVHPTSQQTVFESNQ